MSSSCEAIGAALKAKGFKLWAGDSSDEEHPVAEVPVPSAVGAPALAGDGLSQLESHIKSKGVKLWADYSSDEDDSSARDASRLSASNKVPSERARGSVPGVKLKSAPKETNQLRSSSSKDRELNSGSCRDKPATISQPRDAQTRTHKAWDHLHLQNDSTKQSSARAKPRAPDAAVSSSVDDFVVETPPVQRPRGHGGGGSHSGIATRVPAQVKAKDERVHRVDLKSAVRTHLGSDKSGNARYSKPPFRFTSESFVADPGSDVALSKVHDKGVNKPNAGAAVPNFTPALSSNPLGISTLRNEKSTGDVVLIGKGRVVHSRSPDDDLVISSPDGEGELGTAPTVGSFFNTIKEGQDDGSEKRSSIRTSTGVFQSPEKIHKSPKPLPDSGRKVQLTKVIDDDDFVVTAPDEEVPAKVTLESRFREAMKATAAQDDYDEFCLHRPDKEAGDRGASKSGRKHSRGTLLKSNIEADKRRSAKTKF